MELFLASVLGLLFGFVLQKVGAANPNRIIGMLRLRDFHLMKAILLAIGVSSFLLYLLLSLELIHASHLSIKPAYAGVVIGGAILGIGWAIAGFCPGTALVATGAGRRDALFFVVGGLVGAFVYTLLYGSIQDSFLFESIGSKTALVNRASDSSSGLPIEYYELGIAGSISTLLIVVSFWLPERLDDEEI